MVKIFISYGRASKDVVEQLVQDLTDDDHEIWFDQHLTGGQNWWDNILSEIRQCEIFVAALTPAFLESRACQREMNYAKNLQRIRLPVRLSDKVSADSLPPELSELQWVDYAVRNVEALKSLQRTLRHLPKAPPLPESLPPAPPVPISYLCSLRARIETDLQLQLQDQVQLVFELRQRFRNGDPANEIIDLLQQLKRRDDLYATVSQDIDHLQREIDSGPPAQGPGPVPSPAPEVTALSPEVTRTVRKATGPVPSPAPEVAALSPEVTTRVCALLTQIVGPIASHLVQKESQGVASLEELVRRLAAHIGEEKDRALFIASVRGTVEGNGKAEVEIGGSRSGWWSFTRNFLVRLGTHS